MTTAFELPLQATPQMVSVALNGTTYQMTVWWNFQNSTWHLDIADSSGNDLVTGIPMVTGVDLLAQYEYLGIGVQLQVQTDNNTFAMPTFDNLGSGSHLYVVTS